MLMLFLVDFGRSLRAAAFEETAAFLVFISFGSARADALRPYPSVPPRSSKNKTTRKARGT